MSLTISHSSPTTTLVSGDQGKCTNLCCWYCRASLSCLFSVPLPPSLPCLVHSLPVWGKLVLSFFCSSTFLLTYTHCHPPAGVAGFVVNDKEEVLLVQEKWLRRLSIRHWKLPGGHSERGTGTAAVLTRM